MSDQQPQKSETVELLKKIEKHTHTTSQVLTIFLIVAIIGFLIMIPSMFK